MKASLPRTGLTLLEIILALAIFGASMAALSQLGRIATRSTVQARLQTQGMIRCDTKLNEVLSGIEPMQAVSATPFPDDSRWTWSMNVTQSSHAELVQLDVTVSHRGGSQMASVDVHLRRWARQQALFVKAVEQELQEEQKKAATK